MELEKQIEAAMARLLSEPVFDPLPSIRAFLVDDSPNALDEKKSFPCITLLCGTAQPYIEGDILYTADVQIEVATNYLYDRKRQTLSRLFSTTKSVLNTEAINAELPEWMKCVGTEIQEGAPEIEGNEQTENFALKIWFAAESQE